MKKGFTLIELITVIVLLSLIAVFTFPSVNKVLIERKEKLYNIQVDNIKSSAQSYIDKNDLLNNSSKVIVTLCQLKQNGFTDEKLKDPRNNEYIPDDSKVIVTKDEKIFVYGTKNNTTCTRTDTTLFEYVEINSVYKETIDTSNYNVTIYKDNVKVDKIDTSILTTYFIEYENETKKINKYVYIVDTTNPIIKYKNKINNSYEIGEKPITIEANTNVFVPYEVIVTDNSNEHIEPIIKTNVNTKIPGTYYVTYTATDKSNNTVTKTQTIIVVDTKPPIIDEINGIPENKTPMSIVISILAHDEGVGLHPEGAYSFDGGKTWQVSNSITVDENTTLNIVVRDSASNETKKTIKITNILKDDKNISFVIKKGNLKNNGWYTNDVEVLVKPLVSKEYFDSFSYCTSNNKCEPNIKSTNYDGETIKLSDNTSGTLICGMVNKKDGTKTDVLCSNLFQIDKTIPDVSYEFISGKQNVGYESWYAGDVTLRAKTSSISGIEKIEYCTTTNTSCTPNKTEYSNTPDIILSSNSKTNKICSIATNKAGTRGQNTCSINYQIDKTIPSVTIEVEGSYDDYIGKTATIKAIVDPSSTISDYIYIWYKNGTQIQKGLSNTLIINNGDNLYREDTYKVEVITGSGNKGETSKKLKVDTIKPTCTLAANGTRGNGEWFISSSVNIIGSFKDNESGVISKGVGTSYGYNGNTSYSVSSNTNSTTIYCSVKDKVGNEGSNSITIKKDDGSSTTCSLSGENSSWTNSEVWIEYEMRNSASGFADLQESMYNKISVFGDELVDSGQYASSNDNSIIGLEAIFYNSVEYKTMSFDMWSAKLNSGATVSCPAKTVNVYYDGVKPTCSFDGNTPNGNNGWYKSTANIKATFNDGNGSGIDKYGVGDDSTSSYNNQDTYVLSGNTSGKTLTCLVKDKAGNVGSNTINVKKDDGSSTSCWLDGENSTWTNKQVIISYRMNNSLSGIDTSYNGDSQGFYRLFGPGGYVELQTAFQTEGLVAKTTTFPSWTWRTNSGAIASCSSKTANVYYDSEKPTCSISISGTMGNNGWYKTKSTASVNGSDGSGSGVASALIGYTASNAISSSITINEGGRASQLVGIVKDKAGNTTTCIHGEWKVDATIPSVKVTATVASGTWTNKDVTLYGGVTPDGVDSVFSGYTYRWTRDGTYVGSTKNITATSSGTYTLTVTTGAGNSASASYTVKIDKNPPSCDYSGGSSSWTKNPVTIKIGCKDSESGCASGEKSETISTLTRTKAMTTTIKDKAGNSTVCTKTFDVYYDNTTPTCSVSVTTASGTNGISGTVSASDTGSGINGSASETFANLKANKIFSFNDNAGNSVSCTVKVKNERQYRTRTCNTYKTCQDSSCGYATCKACYDSCLTGSNTCKEGYTAWKLVKKYVSQAQCTANVSDWSQMNVTVKCDNSGQMFKRTYSSCAIGSNTCKGGYYNCKKASCGYASCSASVCGCETYGSWSSWNTTYCAQSDTCQARTYYSKG